MIDNLLCIVLLFFSRKEVEVMMAMFFAQRVILGKISFSKVPKRLKDEVKEILIESGLEELTREIDEKE